MKKLLFTLVATAACGAASAAVEDFSSYTLGAEFSAATNATGEVSGSNPGYWTINMSETPEMLITNRVADTTDKYLQINTGSTPLWRTFEPVTSRDDATSGNPTTNAVGDVTLVQSDVKLTACTEFPNIPDDFVNEKLAIFLYAPEDETAAAAHPGGLYAVGGKIVDSALVATAYRLNVETNAITDTEGWATIAIKSYADVMSNNTGNEKYPGFVIAVAPKGSEVIPVVSAVEEGYAPGFNTGDLTSAAATRIGNRTLIPSAKTSVSSEDYPKGTLLGLGFQGEGGIDNVNLAVENDFAVDAVTMNVTVSQQDVTVTAVTGASAKLVGNKLEFTESDPQEQVTIKFTSTADIVKVNGERVTANENVYTYAFTPVKDGSLEITTEPALFQANGTGYGTFAEALTAALAAGADGTVTLLADLPLGTTVLSLTSGNVTIDLNGQTISGSGNETDGATVIMNSGANLVITDSSASQLGNITANNGAYAIWNSAGTLTVNKGIFNGAIFTDDAQNGAEGTATINDGKFSVKVEAAAIPGDKQWSDLTDGYYTLENKAGSGDDDPVIGDAIADEVGKVEETEDEEGNKTATVTVTNASTSVSITVPADYQGTVNVVVPPTVDTITGLGNASLTIKYENTNISGAFTTTTTDGTTTIALNENGVVTMTDGEEIPVKPVLADDDAEGVAVAPFEVSAEGDAAANVAAIPGLTYELVTTDDLDSNEFGPIVGNDEVVLGAKKKATGKRVKLEDKRSNKGAKGFYKVKVTK